MKNAIRKTLAVLNKKALTAAVLPMVAFPALAQTGGLDRAENALGDLEQWLMQIVPIIATLAFIVAGIMYMCRIGNLEIMGRIAVGAVIIGSASALVGMFLG